MATLFFFFYGLIVTGSSSITWTVQQDIMPRAYSSMAYGYNSSLIWLLGGLQEDMLWSRNEFTFNPLNKKWELLFRDWTPELFECSAQCSSQFETFESESNFEIFIMGPIQQKSHGDNGWIYYPLNDFIDDTTFSYFPDQAEWPCTVADNKRFNHSQIVYIIGGIGEQDSKTWPIGDILAYNLTNGGSGWIQKKFSKMNTPRYAGSCILVNDFIYYFGGNDGQNVINSIEKYDILNDEWITLNTTLNIKRTGHRNVYIAQSNSILIIGGITDMFDTLSSVEWFDIKTEQIINSFQSNMNYKRDEVGAITWNNGDIYVFGGTYNGSYVHNTYEIGVVN